MQELAGWVGVQVGDDEGLLQELAGWVGVLVGNAEGLLQELAGWVGVLVGCRTLWQSNDPQTLLLLS